MGGHQRVVRALALAAVLHVAVANECANEPPLLGAHYMSNWHTGKVRAQEAGWVARGVENYPYFGAIFLCPF